MCIRDRLRPCVIIFTVLIILHGAATLLYVPHVAAALERSPWIYGIAALAVISIASIWLFIHRNRPGWAFVASCSTMGCMMALFGTAMFPNLLYSMPNPEHSLTLVNGSSTRESLVVMTYIAIMGVPLIGISYDPKCTAFLNSVGLDKLSTKENFTAELFLPEAERVLETGKEQGQCVEVHMVELSRKLDTNEKMICTIMEKSRKHTMQDPQNLSLIHI